MPYRVDDAPADAAVEAAAPGTPEPPAVPAPLPVPGPTEQAAASRDLDGRSDLYAVGCVLYEMLVGQPPFGGATAQQMLARHAMDPVPPLRTVRDTVPVGVERSVMRALAKVPADRFATP